MDYNYYDNYDIWNYATEIDSTTTATGLGVFGAMFIVYLVVAMWKIFTKAGEKGWKSIIPIYNIVILFKISGLSPWLILVYLAGIIPFIGWIACFIITIMQANGLAKSFGKSAAYTVGLIFLAPIFYMILGFSKAEYIGIKK